jgi:hypothetical protein
MRSGDYSKRWWAAPASGRDGAGCTRLDVAQAVGLLAIFVISMVGNVLATSGKVLVKYTNTAIANTHPVYGLPAGYAFAIWGLIYVLEAIFVLYQLLPCVGGLSSPAARAIRGPAAGVFVCNVAWLALFGNERYWPALLVIVLYDLLLFRILSRLDAQHALSPIPLLRRVILGSGFSANASWVTVASVLQIQVNLLEEGWLPSADFAIGLLLLAIAVAVAATFTRADVLYALVAAWVRCLAARGLPAPTSDAHLYSWPCPSHAVYLCLPACCRPSSPRG